MISLTKLALILAFIVTAVDLVIGWLKGDLWSLDTLFSIVVTWLVAWVIIASQRKQRGQ